jgi:hypothetical protein
MCCACRSSVSVLDNQETVRVDRSPNAAIRDYLSGLKPRMRSFETAWWISCSRSKRCATVPNSSYATWPFFDDHALAKTRAA